jgi:hypothetical protein
MPKLTLTEKQRDALTEKLEKRFRIVGTVDSDDKSTDQAQDMWWFLQENRNGPLAVSRVHIVGSDQWIAIFSKKPLTKKQLREWTDVFEARDPNDDIVDP